ncbi:hypothetical protein D9M68_680080 [compost metagenome]|uniref:Uncharacterized protein n=1 Tax=Achromobacter agilis TaxID=1353888 RepID=A0A446CAX1_9BURK|nr:hypothetical protein [Achromobacter agilis]SSW65047.1 hypothetical protein AGI3411_01930 [Achromobacter agilis]
MKSKESKPNPSADDTARETQTSHRDVQNRTKKEGHVSQIGTGQDQQSQRNRGGGARSKG